MLARENSHTFEVAWIPHKEHDGTTIVDGTHLSSIKRVSFSHLLKQIAIVGHVNLYRRPQNSRDIQTNHIPLLREHITV
jgi:hypothetical protein